MQFIGIWELGSFISGQWTWRDGNNYEGTFFEDRPIGHGVYKFRATNNELEGLYERSELEPPDLSKEKLQKKKPKKNPKKLPPPPLPIIQLDFLYPKLKTRGARIAYY